MTKILVVINNNGTHSVYADTDEPMRVAVVSKPRLAALAGAANGSNDTYREAAHGPTRFIRPQVESDLEDKRDELVAAQAPVRDTEYEVTVKLKVRAGSEHEAKEIASEMLEGGNYSENAVTATPISQPASENPSRSHASFGCGG